MQIKYILLFSFIISIIVSCGFKGPLYLPPKEAENNPVKPVASNAKATNTSAVTKTIASVPKANASITTVTAASTVKVVESS